MAHTRRYEPNQVEPSARLALATVVAVRGSKASLLSPLNKKTGQITIVEAADRDRPFFVKVADHLLAIDCDDPDPEAANQLIDYVKTCGLDPVVTASGGHGRRHVFVRCPTPEVRAAIASKAELLGLDVRQSIRPPLARHRNQTDRSELLSPTDPARAIELLWPNPEALPLPVYAQVLLRFGDCGGRFRSSSEPSESDRSRIDWAIVCAAVRADMSIDALLLNPVNLGGERVREEEERRRGGARAYVEHAWNKAVGHVGTGKAWEQRERVLVSLTEAGTRAMALDWSTDPNGTAWRVFFDGHMVIAKRAVKLTYGASQRELASRTGVATQTVRSANERLRAMGLIEQEGDFVKTHEWSIVCATSPIINHTPPPKDCGEVAHTPHDAFMRGGLGNNGLRIVRAVGQGASSEQALRCALQLNRTTIKRRLNQLIEVGLLRCANNGVLTVVEECSLDECAQQLGTAGRLDANRQRHAEDRAAYALAVAQSQG